jgi:hypothetical protein
MSLTFMRNLTLQFVRICMNMYGYEAKTIAAGGLNASPRTILTDGEGVD